MDLAPPAAGHYWKTPFVWQPGDPPPPAAPKLRFEPADDEAWLRDAIGAVMSSGTDASDRYTVPRIGVAAAVQEVYDLLPKYFERPSGWWLLARDDEGQAVGFVLTVLFKEERHFRAGRPRATIFYMGVLPAFRGRGHALELVHAATRLAIGAQCWQMFCDTGTENLPMVHAFRRAGYQERPPWQRPLG